MNVKGKTVAIVGKAASLVGSGEGPTIDSFDVVIRINCMLPLDPKQAADIGTRTDLLFLNRAIKAPARKAKELRVPFERYNAAFRREIADGSGWAPFTGTSAVIWFLRKGAKHVYATGMDLYSTGSITGRGGHLRKREVGGGTHDPNKDCALLKKVAEESGKLSFGKALQKAIDATKPLKHYQGLEPDYSNIGPNKPDGGEVSIPKDAKVIPNATTARSSLPRFEKRNNARGMLRSHLKGKSIALVGRSSLLKGSKEGKTIDSYDVVVRINQVLPIEEASARDVGSRTDIVYTCKKCSIRESAKQAAHKHGVFWMPSDLSFRQTITDRWTEGTPFIPFTGTLALLEFLLLPVREIYVTGVDLYSKPCMRGDGGKLKMTGGRHNLRIEWLLLKETLQTEGRFVPWGPLFEILGADEPPEYFKENKKERQLALA